MTHELEFDVALIPGRFDATPAQMRAAWDAEREAGADLIDGTEAGSGKFDSAFRAPGWEFFRGDGECVVAWRTDVFERAWKGAGHTDRIGTPFFRGGNKDARTPIASVPLRHIGSGVIVRNLVPHMPAHIQAGDGFRKTTARVIQQGRAWVTSLAALGRRVRRFKKNHPNAAELVDGDFNVDFHRRHWRALVARVLDLTVAEPLPDGGDLGPRCVSWYLVRGLRVVAVKKGAKHEGLDHRTGRIRFQITVKEKP